MKIHAVKPPKLKSGTVRSYAHNCVDYETQWIHSDLKPEQYLVFKAHTHLDHIVAELENCINQAYPGLNQRYLQSLSVKRGFSQLYKNQLSHYRGWQVVYRKPGQSEFASLAN